MKISRNAFALLSLAHLSCFATLLNSCSSMPETANRDPASYNGITPYVRGTGNNSVNPNVPFLQGANANPTGTHDSNSQNSKTSIANQKKTGEAGPVCNFQTLAQYSLGQDYNGNNISVQDALLPAWNQDIRGTRNFGSFTGSLEQDREILSHWFGNTYSPGSEVFEAAHEKGSEAFLRAFRFLKNDYGDVLGRLKNQDFFIDARMAAVLASLIATSDQPECTKFIRTNIADRVLTPQAAKQLDSLPMVAAAQLEKANTLHTDFLDLEKNKAGLQKALDDLDKAVAKDEKKVEGLVKKVTKDVSKTFEALKVALNKEMNSEDGKTLKPCRQVPNLALFVDSQDTTQKPLDNAQEMVEQCRQRIQDRLDALNEEMAKQKEKSEDLAERTRKGEPVSDADMDILDGKIDALSKRIGDHEEFLKYLNDPDQSVTKKIDELKDLVGEQQKIAENDPVAADHKKMLDIEKQLNQMAPKYLTYGFDDPQGLATQAPLNVWGR